MKPKDIRRAVRESFTDETQMALDKEALMDEVIELGRRLDLDALFAARLSPHGLLCALTVGRSMLYGAEMGRYLLAYCDDQPERVRAIYDTLAADAAESIHKTNFFIGKLRRENDERWRAFRGADILTAEQIRESASAAQG